MSIEAMNQGLYAGFVEMAQIRCCLSRLLAEHKSLRVDEAESIDHDFPFDRLDGVDDDGDSSGCQLLERLLGVDVDAG